VPIQIHFDRKTVGPGDFAFDTVAHCGACASGQFCKTLTGTSLYSGWVEERALLNSANKWVALAIEDIRASLPFPLTGGHYDNGMEFINKPLLAWRLERRIKATRSRPYRKNDNCFAEQKNDDVFRKTVGYFRFDTQAEQEALVEGYRKVYEKPPVTPYQQLLESPLVSGESKAEAAERRSKPGRAECPVQPGGGTAVENKSRKDKNETDLR
jgi:hypothetical protein